MNNNAPSDRNPKGGRRRRKSRRQRRSQLGRLRNYFFTGLIVTAPVAITFWILFGFIKWVDGKVVPLIPPAYNPQTYIQTYFDTEVYIPGIGLIVVFIGLTLIGFFAAGLLGRMVVRSGENLVNRMPVVRSVYGALKQIFQTVLESSSRSFREVVLVEYPRRGIWAIGFITSTTEGEVQSTIKDKVVNVFLPTTPNPTSGFLLFVPRGDLVVLDMSVEEGIKMVVSAGIVTPPDRRPDKVKAIPKVASDGARLRESKDLEKAVERTAIPSEET